MTPYEIQVLLHYYAGADDHSDHLRGSDLFRDTVQRLTEWGLFGYGDDAFGRTYRLTARGKAYAQALQRVPLPTPAWIVEWEPEVIK